MKLNRKIKAFTLSEMIVVLILTVIVVGLAFSVLTLVQKQMQSIQANFEKSSEINRLETALYVDFNKYSNVQFLSQINTLKFKSSLDSIFYQVEGDKVIRIKDTFNVSISKRQFFLVGELTNNGAIDAIKLETSKATQNQPIFVYKQNDATQFMMRK